MSSYDGDFSTSPMSSINFDSSFPAIDSYDYFSTPPSPNNAAKPVAVILSLLIMAAIVVISVFCARKARRAIVSELRAAVAPPPPSTTIHVWEVVDAPTMERFFHELAQEKPVCFTAQQLCSFTENYTTVLGSGGFGKVYKGVFPNGIKIVVKVLNRTPQRARCAAVHG